MIKLILKKLSITFIAISFTVISSVASAEITITWPSIWVGKDSKTTVIGELIDEFNAANAGSIKVVVEEQTDYDIYAQKLTAQIATGELPDIMTVGAQLLDVLHRSGKAMDLAPHINSDPHWNNVYPENALQSAMTDGVLSALPYELFVTCLLYTSPSPRD